MQKMRLEQGDRWVEKRVEIRRESTDLLTNATLHERYLVHTENIHECSGLGHETDLCVILEGCVCRLRYRDSGGTNNASHKSTEQACASAWLYFVWYG